MPWQQIEDYGLANLHASFASREAFQAGLSEAGELMSAFMHCMITLGGASSSMQETLPKPLAVDIWVALIYVIGIFLLAWGLRKLVIEPLARRKLFCHLRPRRRNMIVQKFTQSWMEAIVYGLFFFFGMVILCSHPWSWPSRQWWLGLNTSTQSGSASSQLALRPDVRCFYILYGARYVSFGISGLLEHKRKDFIEMQIHHWVTVVLAALSYAYGWIRVGTIVMVLLDPADVPLHIAKMCKYISDADGPRASKFKFTADRFFEVFAVAFFVTRLCMYPYVCWSAAFESSKVWASQAGKPSWVHDFKEWVAIVLLLLVQVLQIYWFLLIVKVAITLLRNGEVADIRSDDEVEEDDDNQQEPQQESAACVAPLEAQPGIA